MRLSDLHYIQLLNEATQEIYCRSSNANKRIESDAIKIEEGNRAIITLKSISMYFKGDEYGHEEWQHS